MSTRPSSYPADSAVARALDNVVIRDHLFALLPKRDLATCCRLSKSLFEPVVKHLYQDINEDNLFNIFYNDRWATPGKFLNCTDNWGASILRFGSSETMRACYRRKLYQKSVRTLRFTARDLGNHDLKFYLVEECRHKAEAERYSDGEDSDDEIDTLMHWTEPGDSCLVEAAAIFLQGTLPGLTRYITTFGTNWGDLMERVFKLDGFQHNEGLLTVTMHGDVLWTKEQVRSAITRIAEDQSKCPCEEGVDVEVIQTPYCRDGSLPSATNDIIILTGKDVATVRMGHVSIANFDPRETGGQPIRTWPVSSPPPDRSEWDSFPTRGIIQALGSKITNVQMHFFATADDIVAIGQSCPALQSLSRTSLGGSEFRDRHSVTEFGPTRCLDLFVVLAVAAPYMSRLQKIRWSCWPASAQWQMEQIQRQTGHEVLPKVGFRNNVYPFLTTIEGQLPCHIQGSLACLDSYNGLIRSVVTATYSVSLSPSNFYLPRSGWQEAHPEDQRTALGEEGVVYRSVPEEPERPLGLYGQGPFDEDERLAHDPSTMVDCNGNPEENPSKLWQGWLHAHDAYWNAWKERLRLRVGDLMVPFGMEEWSRDDIYDF